MEICRWGICKCGDWCLWWVMRHVWDVCVLSLPQTSSDKSARDLHPLHSYQHCVQEAAPVGLGFHA